MGNNAYQSANNVTKDMPHNDKEIGAGCAESLSHSNQHIPAKMSRFFVEKEQIMGEGEQKVGEGEQKWGREIKFLL